MIKITKGIIPCAGLGTRLMPITKAVPKQMLPIIDRPCLDYIVDEMVQSGITDILFIVSPDKECIKDYFSADETLYNRLDTAGHTDITRGLRQIDTKAKYHFAVQKEARGSGDAVLLAEDFAGGEPFALAWGDDVTASDREPVTSQLINIYETYGKTVIGVQQRAVPEILGYGVINIEERISYNLMRIKAVDEKPDGTILKSNYGTLGRYVVTPAIFAALKNIPMKNGEFLFTDALNILAKYEGVYALDFYGKRYDMGNKAGSVKAIIDFALANNDIKEEIRMFLGNKYI